MDIRVQNGENLSLAIKKALIKEGAADSDLKKFSIWNQILDLVDQQNAENKANGKKAIYEGGNDRTSANWSQNYRVLAGSDLSFSDEIWNQIKSIVGLTPSVPKEQPEALNKQLDAPVSPFEKKDTFPVPQQSNLPKINIETNYTQLGDNPSSVSERHSSINPDLLPISSSAQNPSESVKEANNIVLSDMPAIESRDTAKTDIPTQSVELEKPTEVLPSGAIVNKDGSIKYGEYLYSIDENGMETLKTKYGTYKATNMMNRDIIANTRAKIFGYHATNVPNLYLKDNQYYKWDENSKNYVKATIETQEARQTRLNAENRRKEEIQKLKATTADGVLENFAQDGKGDCWLISSLKALNNSEKGKEIIKSCLSADNAGNITVNLKGIDKSYTITNDEINAAIDSENSALGDKDAIAIELAFEKHIKSAIDSKKTNSNMDSINAGRYSMGDDYLYGGRPKVAIETLTGLNVSTISRSKDKNIVVQDHVALLKGMNEDTLKPFMDNKDYTIIVSVDGADEKRKDLAHGFAFKGYDENFVYLEDTYLNDDGSAKITKMKKDDFYSRLLEFSYTDLSKPLDKANNSLMYSPKITQTKEVEQYLKNKDNN